MCQWCNATPARALPGGRCRVYNNTLTGELRCVWGEEREREPLCFYSPAVPQCCSWQTICKVKTPPSGAHMLFTTVLEHKVIMTPHLVGSCHAALFAFVLRTLCKHSHYCDLQRMSITVRTAQTEWILGSWWQQMGSCIEWSCDLYVTGPFVHRVSL